MFTSEQISQMMANQQQATMATNMHSQALSNRMVGGSVFSSDPTMAASGGLGVLGGIGHAAMAPLNAMSSLPGIGAMMLGSSDIGKKFLGNGLISRSMGLGMSAVTRGFGIPFTAATYGLEKAGRSFMEGAQGYVSTSHFANQWGSSMGNIGGRPFSQQDKGEIHKTIKGLAELKGFNGDIKTALDFVKNYRDAGMLEGVRNGRQFSKRFGELMKGTNDIVKTLGTSLQNAQSMLVELDKVGIKAGGVKAAASSLRRQADATGMSIADIHAFRAQEAEANWQNGGFRATGYMAAGKTLSLVNAMVKGGGMSQDVLQHLTGTTGNDAVLAAAGMVQQAGSGMSGTQYGKKLINSGVFSQAYGEIKNGRYTGGVDADLQRRIAAGGVSMTDLQRIAKERYGKLDWAGKQSFELHKGTIAAEMGSEQGGLAMLGMAGKEFDDRFKRGDYKGKTKHEAMTAFSANVLGADKNQAQMLALFMQLLPKAQKDVEKSQYASITEEARQSVRHSKYGKDDLVDQIADDFKKGWKELWQPLREAGASVAKNIEDHRKSQRDRASPSVGTNRASLDAAIDDFRNATAVDVRVTPQGGKAPVVLSDDAMSFNYFQNGGESSMLAAPLDVARGSSASQWSDPMVRAQLADQARRNKGRIRVLSAVHRVRKGGQVASSLTRDEYQVLQDQATRYRTGVGHDTGDTSDWVGKLQMLGESKYSTMSGGAAVGDVASAAGMSTKRVFEYYSRMQGEYGGARREAERTRADAAALDANPRASKKAKKEALEAAQAAQATLEGMERTLGGTGMLGMETLRRTAGAAVGGAESITPDEATVAQLAKGAVDAKEQYSKRYGAKRWGGIRGADHTLENMSNEGYAAFAKFGSEGVGDVKQVAAYMNAGK